MHFYLPLQMLFIVVVLLSTRLVYLLLLSSSGVAWLAVGAGGELAQPVAEL